jgi:flagellar assembly protein FliH
MAPSKFQFDTEFRHDGDHVSMAARARARKTMSAEEIDALCAKARGEGMKAGEARALDAVAQGTRDVASVLREALSRTHNDIEHVRAEAAELALAMARRIAAVALEALPAADVEVALREAIHQAIGEPRIVVRASQRVVDVLADKLADIAHEEGFEGRVVIGADPAIRGADCRIEWRGGGAERSETRIDQHLRALIARRFSNTTEE